MIQAKLETTHLIAGQVNRLVIKLTNVGSRACRSIVFRVRLPSEIAVLEGHERIYLSDLMPGAVEPLRMLVRPSQGGVFLLVSANFHYLDGSNQAITPPQWRQQVIVEAPQFSPEQHAALEAERHARAQRWEAAWRLYLQARDGRQALDCLQRAVQHLQSRRQLADVFAQYLSYAQMVRELEQPYLASDAQMTRGLEQAIEWYLQAQQPAEAHRCRDLLGYLTGAPLLEVRMDFTGSAAFVAGVASLATVEVTNRGYGPAYQIRLRLDGAVERADEWQLERLGVGQTAVWQDACVIPSHPGQCVLRVQVLVGGADSDTGSLTWYRTAVAAAPPDLLGQVGRQRPGAAPLHIEKYFGSGTTYFDTGLVYTPARSRTDYDPAGRWSVVIGDVQDRKPDRCRQCKALVDREARFCAQCGAPVAANKA